MSKGPRSVEAEQAVLGSVLFDPESFALVAERLEADDFCRPDHQLIYSAMRALATRAMLSDPVTVDEELRSRKQSDEAGGLAYLAQLARDTPTSANIRAYADIVHDRAIGRRAIAQLERTVAALNDDKKIASVLAEAEKELGLLKDSCADSRTRRSKLASVEVHEFLLLEIPPREYLLSPILPAQGIVMVYGPRGLGKTQISVGIAVAVTSGGKFLKWSAEKPSSVLLVDGEMPASAMQTRLADAITASETEPVAPLRLVTPDLNWEAGMPDLSTVEGQKAVDALITEDTKLVIVDNLSSLLRTGVENDSESWLPLQTWALRHRAAGRSILFVHHAGKGGAQRGTSRREDVLDCVVALRRPSDYQPQEGARFEVHIEKGRSLFGKDATPFEAKLAIDPHGKPIWAIRDLECDQANRIEEMTGLGMKPAEIAHELGVSKATVYRRLNGNGKVAETKGGATGHA